MTISSLRLLKSVPMIGYYIQALRRRLWIVALFVVTGAMISLIHTAKTPPLYVATSRILIEQETPKLQLFNDIVSTENKRDFYRTQFRILQSRNLARRVIDALHLRNHPEWSQSAGGKGLFQEIRHLVKSFVASAVGAARQVIGLAPRPNAKAMLTTLKPDASAKSAADTILINRFVRRLKVKPVEKTHLVSVSFTSQNPKLAAEVVNTLNRLYMDMNLEMRFSATQEALEWLNNRVGKMRQNVEDAELSLQQYKAEHNIFSVGDNLPGILQELSHLNKSIIQARTESIEAKTFYQSLLRPASLPKNVEWIPSVVENSLIQTLKGTHVDLQRKFSQLAKKYGPIHPQVVQIRSQMDTVKKKIDAEVQKIVHAAKARYEIAKAREMTLNERAGQLKEEAKKLDHRAVQYGVLKRDAESNQRLYDLLLNRLKETSINTELKGGKNVTIIDAAEVPQKSLNIHPVRSLFTASILGFVASVGLIVGLTYLDRTIKTPEEVTAFLDLPNLGVIEQHKAKIKDGSEVESQSPLVTIRAPHSLYAESFKRLRTNLLLSFTDPPRQVFLVTSACPREGKTTIATNLAVVMSQLERRVLLVDGDLRSPSVHQMFDKNRDDLGLSDLLLAETYESALVSQNETLTTLTAGTEVPNPSELLGSSRMARFIAFARQQYDTVIIDSSPILSVSDALILSPLVDGIIFVVRANLTSYEHAKRTHEQLQGTDKVLGVVLNSLNPRDNKSYTASSYYYGYHSGESA